jgi:hypothetical protein
VVYHCWALIKLIPPLPPIVFSSAFTMLPWGLLYSYLLYGESLCQEGNQSRVPGKSPRYPLDRRLAGPQNLSGLCRVETNLLPRPSCPLLYRLGYMIELYVHSPTRLHGVVLN